MRKIIVGALATCGLFFTLTGNVMAQTGVRFGVKAGGSLNFSKVSAGKVSYSGDSRVGFFGGGFMEVSPNSPENKFKLQLEALYSRENLQISDPAEDGMKVLIDINQINVPLLAKYFVLPELSINLGPTFNFNLSGSGTGKDNQGEKTDLGKMDDLKSFQMGLAAGASYYICKGLFIDARFTPLFGGLNTEDEINYKASAIKLGIGYKF